MRGLGVLLEGLNKFLVNSLPMWSFNLSCIISSLVRVEIGSVYFKVGHYSLALLQSALFVLM